MTSLPWRSLAFATLLALDPGSAGAQVIIEPVVLELQQARRAVTLRVANQGTQALHFQASIFRWSQAGDDRRVPSDQLLVVPPIAQIAAGATQTFRIALRYPQAAPVERAFRLLLENISPAEQSAGAQVALPISHDLPVLVAPAGPTVKAIAWSDCAAPGAAMSLAAPAKHCLRLANQGNRRLKFDAITVLGPHGEQRVKLPAARNLLAGSFLDLPMPADLPRPRPSQTVLVHATEGEPVQARAVAAAP